MLIVKKHITRDYALQKPTTIFLFGDNMQRTGFGGQAQAMRGLTNSFGVPTKWSPYTGETAYFSNDDMPKVRKYVDFPFDVAIAWLQAGGDVCIPADGFGTGLAQLEKRAPTILSHINLRLLHLRDSATTIKEIP